MGIRIVSFCIVLITILYISCGTIDAASLSRTSSSLSADSYAAAKKENWPVRTARQAADDDSAEEENYDDDDDGGEEGSVKAEEQQQPLPAAANDDDDEEADDDDDDIEDEVASLLGLRRRRDIAATEAAKIKESAKEQEALVVPEPMPAPATTEQQAPAEAANIAAPITAASTPAVTPTPTQSVTPSRNTSVLILIRDALKKVTTLPTEQVATNALQYFQLFEHFIQQTIENVIGNDDDDEDEGEAASAAAASAAAASSAAASGAAPAEPSAGIAEATATNTKPEGIFSPEEEELMAGVEEILKEPELVTKQPAVMVVAQKPSEMEVEAVTNQQSKPVEAETSAIVDEAKPASAGPIAVIVEEGKPVDVLSKPEEVVEKVIVALPETVGEPAVLESATNSV